MQKGNYLQGGTAARLFLSLIVVFSHFGSLTGLYRNRHLLDADFAVSCFFILSGYAMMHSFGKLWERKGGVKAFYTQRFFRIMVPVAVLVVLQIVLLFSVSSASVSEYAGAKTFKYFLANISLLNFLQQSLPGVFTATAGGVVNGSLWTMKIEMGFYLLFPILYLLTGKKIRWLFVVVFASVTYRVLLQQSHPTLSYQLPGQLYFFVTGMLIYHFGAQLQHNKILMLLGILLLIKNSIWGYHIIETAISFPLILLGLAGMFKHTDTFFKAHDYSFTVYLLHWPIIQVGNHLFFSDGHTLQGIAFVFIVLCACSFLFKKMVEDKAITWGKKYSLRWLK